MIQLLAVVDPQSGSYRTGQLLAPTLSLLGAAKCAAIARRPTTNTKCALSLMFLLLAWASGALPVLFPSASEGRPWMGLVLIFPTLVLVLTSFVLAIIGLVEFANRPGVYVQGRAQAIWALVLCCLFGALATAGFINGRAKALANSPAGPNRPSRGETVRMEDMNFGLTAPGAPWVAMDAAKLNPVAKLAYMRARPEVWFIAIPEKAGSKLDQDHLLEVAMASMRSSTRSLKILHQEPVEAGGVAGLGMSLQAEVANLSIYYRRWFAVTNGFAYQLMWWGRPDERETIDAEATRMLATFHLMDYDRHAIPGETLSDTVSTNLRFSVRLNGSGFEPWADMETDAPAAAFGALRGDDLAIAVVGVALDDLKPNPELVYRSLLRSLLGSDSIQRAMGAREDRSEDGRLGFVTEFTVAEGTFRYRIKVLVGERSAHLVAAWVTKAMPDPSAVLDDAVSRVTLDPWKDPDPAAFTDTELRSQCTVLNDLGLAYYKARQFERAGECFRRVVAFGGIDPTEPYVDNLLLALLETGRYEEGLAVFEKAPGMVSKKDDWRAGQALFQGRLGRIDEALTNYAGLFQAGYADEDHFKEYVGFLAGANRIDEALVEVVKFLKAHDTVETRLLQSGLLKRKGDYEAAATMLEEQRRKNPFDGSVAYALTDAKLGAGQTREALALATQMVEEQSDSAYAWFIKGRCELALKWYRPAKESFEAALAKAPADAEIKTYLDLSSRMLGEGSNTAVKDPIPAVALPEGLDIEPAPAPAGFGQGSGAYYQRRLTAVSFVRGQELRTSDYIRIKALDSTGVATFSTMQFLFNPGSEGLYVNRLEVRNAAGSLVSTGMVSDYYVLDHQDGQMATDQKVLNVPVPGLEPGGLIDIVVTRTELGRVEDFTFLRHSLSRQVPVQESLLFLRGDTNSMRMASSAGPSMKPLGDGFLWTMSNPPIQRWEVWQPPVPDYLPCIWVSDAKSQWRDLATNYLAQIHDRLAVDEATRRLAGEVTRGCTNVGQKVAAVAAYVQTNLTYKAIEFGRRARVPQPVADLLGRRYGDCKDHSLLACQLLNSAGVKAWLTLAAVGTQVRSDLPSLDQFNHMVVFVPGSGLVDCTGKGGDPMRALSGALAGQDVLVLDPAEPRFERVPATACPAALVRSERSIAVTNSVDVVVEETLTLHDGYASGFREYLRAQDGPQRRSYFLALLGDGSPDLRTLEIENLEKAGAPLVAHLVYGLKNHFTRSGEELVGTLPAPFERSYLAQRAVESRSSPFQVNEPLRFESRVRLCLPSGTKVAVAAETSVAGNPFVRASMSVRELPDGKELTGEAEQVPGRFVPARYGEFVEAHAKACELLAPRLKISPKR